MLIAYGSDLHLDADVFIFNQSHFPVADVLILAGDIIEINRFKKAVKTNNPNIEQRDILAFFKKISNTYKHVLWVFGNHEFYHGEFNFAHQNAKTCLKNLGISNIHILENNTFEFEDVVFFGSTLWTTCKNNPIIEWTISRRMNDYFNISVIDQYKERRKFSISDSLCANKIATSAIQKFAEIETNGKKKVLITHHSMSFQSVHENYRGNTLNYAYANDLDNLLGYSDISIAIHGHMHHKQNYQIGDCQVLTNPRGYHGMETTSNGYAFDLLEIA